MAAAFVSRVSLSVAAVLALTVFAGPVRAQDAGSGSGGRARVLVAPLKTGPGINNSFGKKVSDEVRDGLEDFPTLVAVDKKQVDSELKRLKLDKDELGPIQWRQLASRMNAQVIMYGTVEPTSVGNAVNVAFIDAKTGDELSVPEFTVAGDGNDQVRETASTIVTAFGEHVKYQQSVLYCQDYLNASQYEDALRNCNEALTLNPSSLHAMYLRGRIYMGQEDWSSARTDLAVVVDENPAETLALQSLAYTEAQLGNTERATELYREYLNFSPDDADVRLKVAFDLAQAGGHEEAILLLEEGIARDSTNAELWEFLGTVSLNFGTASDDGGSEASIANEDAVRKAVMAYEKTLELKGDDIDPEILTNVIAAYLELGDYESALAFNDRALEIKGEDASLWSQRADIYNRMDDYPEAIAAIDRVLELDPTYANALLRRGMYKLQMGNPDAAIADFRLAVDEQGTDPNVVAGQMLARGHRDYFQKGDYGQAIAMFETGTEFATDAEILEQLFFFTAYGYFQEGVLIDQANEAAEDCAPARRALSRFQQVMPNLNRAGSVQPNAQQQLTESTDVYLYRQEQIIRKACK